ncbi:MAG: YifB family Mg chelatase-like AAA ATPase [Rickettsiales bacterium]
MTVRVTTVAFEGLHVREVDVQIHFASGLPSFSVVGLPDKAVAESRERVRSALHSLGASLPAARVTVNLSPADIVKEGSHYDLPILLGILVELGAIPSDALDRYVAMGEVALDAGVCRSSGVLPAALYAAQENRGIICPEANGREAAFSGNDDVLAASSALQLVRHFKGSQIMAKASASTAPSESDDVGAPDLSDVKGQEGAKRALEIAAAGRHNLLLSGPPGAGKSMLAARLPGILPPMTPKEMLETGMIASVSGAVAERAMRRRPFRAPHHSCSMPAMVGGGRNAMPGEITLAHNGVLFLDELPEFPRNVLDALRQPLETGNVTVSRVNRHVTYPASIQLIAAMNPCRCGYIDDPDRQCRKAPRCGEEYQERISGPLYDRIDMYLDVSEIPPDKLRKEESAGERSAEVLARVVCAREIQAERYRGLPYAVNAHAQGEALDALMRPEPEALKTLEGAYHALKLSMRGYYRTMRVARTIADLEGSASVRRVHALEALGYRRTKAK